MKKKEFIKRMAKVECCGGTCFDILCFVGLDFKDAYQKEFQNLSSNRLFWIDMFIEEHGYLPKSDYRESKFMLRQLVVKMFEHFIIDHTDMLED